MPRQWKLPNLLAFNVGVEMGQLLALGALLLLMAHWRSRQSFAANSFAANVALLAAGVGRLLGLTRMGESKRALAEEAAANASALQEAERASAAERPSTPGDSSTEARAVRALLEDELQHRPAA